MTRTNLNGTKYTAAVTSYMDFTGALTSVGSYIDETYTFNELMRQFDYSQNKLSDTSISSIYAN